MVKPSVPNVKHREWVANEIDAFIVAGYEKKEFDAGSSSRPSHVCFAAFLMILLACRPRREELALFVGDSRPNDYEKVVDRLLANEQHGANYARHWLDVCAMPMWTNTCRHPSGIYRWREWMIHALNQDSPTTNSSKCS